MALTKITAAIIEDGAITASALSDNSIGITQLNVSDGTAGQFLKTDGSGTLSFATVTGYTDSDVDTKLAAGVGNILTTGYIAGPATFTIDPAAVGDNTGTLVVAGNLQVDGTTTTINSTTMTVDDLNITLASGAANAAAANGAGITVDGASATLLYQSTADAWSFNKNVGIGDTSPIAKLTVKAASDTIRAESLATDAKNITMSYEDSNDFGAIRCAQDGVADKNLLLRGASLLFQRSGGTEAMRIDSSGNVGIGTTSPATSLHIANAGNSFLTLERTGTTGGTGKFGINMEGGSSQQTTMAYDDGGKLVIGRSSDPATAAGFNNDFVLDSSGNVGIGTTSPLTELHVYSADQNALTVETNTAVNQVHLSNSTNSPAYLKQNSYGLEIIADANGWGGTASFMAFKVKAAERMRITDTGNVGIGTTSPSTELHVYSADQNALTVETNTGINQIHLSNSTNSPTYLTQDSYSLIFKADENGWGGAASSMQFKVRAAERMRIVSDGELLLGRTTTFGGGNKTSAFFNAKSDANLRLLSANNGGYACLVIHNTGLNTVGSITQNGSNASFNTSSDYRLKENVDYTWDATTRFKQLKPARFNWIRDETNTLQDGFLAHEVEDIVPEAVKGTKDEVKDPILNVVLNAASVKIDEDITEEEWIAGKEDGTYESDTTWVASYDEPMYQQIDHSKLVPLLVKTIQELEARITTLENA